MTLIVTWLWQGLAIACITVLALKATPRLNAATRHVIWWLALAAVLAIPVVHFAAPQAEAPPMPEVVKSASVGAVMLVLPPLPGAVTTGLIAFWVFTLVFGLIRIARSCREVGRLKRTSVLFDVAREARLTMWVSARDSSRRRMGLRMSERRAGACALGLDHPRLGITRRGAQRRRTGRDRLARTGPSRASRRLAEIAAGHRQQHRRIASGHAVHLAADRRRLRSCL